MQTITNNGRRRLGLPGRPALILGPGETKAVTPDQWHEIERNKTIARWIEAGVLTMNGDGTPTVTVTVTTKPKRGAKVKAKPEQKIEEPTLPEGLTGQGVEFHDLGYGWWQVYVNGFKVTDRSVRRDEADAMAKEYE